MSQVWRYGIRAALVVLVGLLASGCLYTNASLTIDGEDLVAGEVLLSTETADGEVPFELTPPPGVADRVRITPYATKEQTGYRVSFRDLSFHEVEELSSALSPSDSRYHMHLRREGSLVIFDASLDLTPLTGTDSEFFVEISAPGEITNTNGEQGAGTVTWRPEAGELTRMSAIYQFSGAYNQEWFGWMVLMWTSGFGVAAFVLVMAQKAHENARRRAGVPGY